MTASFQHAAALGAIRRRLILKDRASPVGTCTEKRATTPTEATMSEPTRRWRRVRVVPKPWFPFGWEVQIWRWWWPFWTSDGYLYLYEHAAQYAAKCERGHDE